MGRYAWRSGARSGTSSRKPNYAVKWEWKDPDLHGSYGQFTDIVHATNAERAINKVRKQLEESDDLGRPNRRDVVIISVVPIEGMYYDGN